MIVIDDETVGSTPSSSRRPWLGASKLARGSGAFSKSSARTVIEIGSPA